MEYQWGEKRKRHEPDDHRPRNRGDASRSHGDYQRGRGNDNRGWATTDQARMNQLQEEERHREFLAQEGQFVLQQKRKAAGIRVKEGRARPIDWLTVNLQIIDPIEDLINDEVKEEELDYYDPEGVVEELTATQLSDIRKEVDDFLDLERKKENRDYWRTMRVICKDRQRGIDGRAVRSVSADIDKLLGPKSYEELEKLEKQIDKKLDSNEPIDTDYWQLLLDHLLVYKAKAKLKKLYQEVLAGKLESLRKQNVKVALRARLELSHDDSYQVPQDKVPDPEPLLNFDTKDKRHELIDEADFLSSIAAERRRIVKSVYIPEKKAGSAAAKSGHLPVSASRTGDTDNKVASSMFDREAAKGVEEDEEVFVGEEQVETNNTDLWKGKYRPRKPRYFNRVQMGYEWNKYNQTHYDHDNPPPKVVQGYKFHIFYPDLIDPSKAPTYKIMREGGRKKGETVAPAGEEDTCIIRFISGPPYEDIAFRIVDRDWDYSAKYDRGFKSTFEKGILSLHFSFKKVYYRK